MCAQRGATGSLPGAWEFPGGKVELGETPQQALQREIEEELGCEVLVGGLVANTTHVYEDITVDLTTYWCELVSGEPQALEHHDLRWVDPAELESLAWAPADLPAVAQVRALLVSGLAQGS
jgi:8-oxo-dGTP diphosphatase